MAAFKISTGTTLATNDFRGNVKNNGSVIKMGGTIVDTSTTTANALGAGKTVLGGSVVVSGASTPYLATVNDTNYAAGHFAKENDFIILGQSVTLGGASNTILGSQGADFANRQTPHAVQNIRTVRIDEALRDGKWNITTGMAANFPETDNSGLWSISGAANNTGTGIVDKVTDDGYSTTAAGEFRVHYGSPTPSGAHYQPKTG